MPVDGHSGDAAGQGGPSHVPPFMRLQPPPGWVCITLGLELLTERQWANPPRHPCHGGGGGGGHLWDGCCDMAQDTQAEHCSGCSAGATAGGAAYWVGDCWSCWWGPVCLCPHLVARAEPSHRQDARATVGVTWC